MAEEEQGDADEAPPRGTTRAEKTSRDAASGNCVGRVAKRINVNDFICAVEARS